MKKSRRNFLGKLSAGLASLGLAHQGLTQENDHKHETMHPILAVQPLGFQWQTADPFLFCVHHDDHFPKGQAHLGPDPALLQGRRIGQDFLLKDGWRMYHGETVPGFPGHPHRGFETITVVRKGLVDHADSLGGAGRYGNGDVQWMTAGKGIQHSEMFPLLQQEQPNPMELFQIWINLPRAHKMVDAHYKMLWSEDIPRVAYTDADGHPTPVEVIAGALDGQQPPTPPPNSWAATPDHQVAVWIIRMAPRATWTLPAAAAELNRTLYAYEGEGLQIAEATIPTYHEVKVQPDRALSLKAGDTGANILLLQGKPIQDPVVQHGPFVMNSRQEIQQAFSDYQQTRFGGWPWGRYDQVHDAKLGRFARHGDGREEFPQR